MKIIQKIQSVVSDHQIRKEIRGQAEIFAKEANIIKKDKFIKDFMEMYECKQIIKKYVDRFSEAEDEVNENIAVTMLGSMLSAILTITTNQDPEYSYKAVEALGTICFNITVETGSPSDQFELMALMQKYSVTEEESEEEEEFE